MTASARLVVNRDGYIVDLETGEVVDEQPLSLDLSAELPPAEDRAEWERRLRVAPVPRARRPRSRTLAVKVPVELLEALDAVVREYGWGSRSALVREVLERFVNGSGGLAPGSLDPGVLRRLRDLYALRSVVMTAQYLLRIGSVYAGGAYRQDVARVVEELEALIHRVNSDLNELHRVIGLW